MDLIPGPGAPYAVGQPKKKKKKKKKNTTVTTQITVEARVQTPAQHSRLKDPALPVAA